MTTHVKVLVLAEHHGGQLAAVTANVVAAAQQLGCTVQVLVAGHGVATVAAQAAALAGVEKVLLADDAAYAHQLPEALAPLLAEVFKDFTHLLAPASTFGKNVLPRAAALADVQMVSDVTTITAADTFVRPIYAGNALQTVKSKQPKHILSVRPTAFAAVPDTDCIAAVEPVSFTPKAGTVTFVKMEAAASDRPALGSTKVVISGGRGLQNADTFKLLEQLADAFGATPLGKAALGASRAAVDAGWVPNDWQVGQTGKVVAPQLYVAVGISGAVQHVAGMQESKIIIAINTDENAPIFEVADYGLVADLFEAIPQLIDALRK